MKYYGPNSMKPVARKDFLTWYTEQLKEKDHVFDMRKEIVEYCHSDVELLREG